MADETPLSESPPPPSEAVPDQPAETQNVVADPSADAPDDANDLRGFHFRRLMRKRLTWILILIFVVIAGAVCGALLGPIFAAVAGAAVMLLALLVVLLIADSKAESAFFEVYATQRRM